MALVLCVLAAEAALQLGALVVRATGRDAPPGWTSARRRVLTLGDSNTYGLRVAPEESWPRQLERRWNTDPARTPIEVLNLGYPGTNASQVRSRIPRLLRTFRPDTVLLMIGANDYWTVRSAEGPGAGLGARAEAFAWRHSRLYRLLVIAHRSIRGEPSLEIDAGPIDDIRHGRGIARFGDERFELGWDQDLAPSIGAIEADARGADDLRAIVAEARRAGVRLILVTYPSEAFLYGLANRRLRAFAAESGTPLVDLAARFRTVCPDVACRAYFQPDDHPNAAGYARAAEWLVETLPDVGGP